MPENALLSHDLFEGLFARACLVTDIEFFEAAPAQYLASAARQHRWARGDWQLLLWILHERIPVIGRWKMIDNLRRTLSMPSALLTLIAGWVWPGSPPLLWTLFVVSTITIPGFVPVFTGAAPRRPGVSKRSHLRALGRDVRFAIYQAALTLTMMAHQAWLMSDAVVRTLGRIFVTRRTLLEWTAAADATSRAPRHVLGLYDRMAGGICLALAAGLAVMMLRPEAWPVAMPLLVLWGLSPAIAQWVSRPRAAVRTVPLSPEEAQALRLIARRTWRFFATFVTPESRALPPDNFQETPHPVVAQRTSPTNIGLYLLAAVTARDFGWVSALDVIGRIEATLGAINGLEHHRGHLYNWYATRDGRPLDPRYVSSVDSGNLAGALMTLANACREMLEQPVIGPAALDGIADAALLLRESAHGLDGARAGFVARRRLDEAVDVVLTITARRPGTTLEYAARLGELESAVRTAAHCARDVGDAVAVDPPSSVLVWADALRASVEAHARDLDTLMPWARLRIDPVLGPIVAPLATPSPLLELPRRCEAVIRDLTAFRELTVDSGDGIDTLIHALERSAAAGDALAVRLAALADTARTMMTAMDFGFLFDPTRLLFAIGYRMSDGCLDQGRYDLLASEARLLSFIAIAKGDVPVKHWFRLGRALTPVGKDSALVSWSGSMFEYLMPALMMQSPGGSLLEQTCQLAVHRQIDYGEERGIPWGVSESGYAARDFEMTYQYSNFGVPGLGFRRGLADDIVVAPYATALATMVEPAEALRNFRELAREGADGQYGFYEALDYTHSRVPAEARCVVVRMYMAHHQAMAIVAIANALNGGVMRARFHVEPAVRASELLLQERTPRDVAVARPRVDSASPIRDVREPVLTQSRHFASPQSATPRTHLLSNGRYAVMITAAGSGYSRWRDLAVTRWREDPTRDGDGSFIFLRDVASGAYWSAGFQPSGAEPESYEVSFSEDRAEFVRRDGAITTRMEVIVSSEDDAEVRRISITNHGTRTREIEVTSYAEIVLAPPAADAAHPAFSNLFVQTERVAERDTLLAARRPRAHDDPPVWLAHVLAVEGEPIGDLEWETDRARFVGRGRSVRAPQAVADGQALSHTVGSVLDPIVSLRRRVRVRPGRTASVAFATLVAASRDDVLGLADKYHDVTTFERAATLAWTQAQVQQHHLGIGPDEGHLFQTIAGSILYSDRAMRSPADVLARQTEGPAALWAHGISGDLPIVVVQIDDAEDIGIVRQLLRAHEYWRMKRLAVDLVILNDRAASYMQDLQALLETFVRTSQAIPRPDGLESQGKVFILRDDLVTPAQRDALLSAARVALSSRRGSLADQIDRADRANAGLIPAVRPHVPPLPRGPRADPPHPELEFFNGLGGFTPDAREYRVLLALGRRTPAPWINVLANPDFGCLVSESGAGCTWSRNSRENQITAWSNDPVSDPPSEMFYVRDDASGDLWCPTALPIREEQGEYIARHGQGYTRFEYDAHGVALELLQFVPVDDPVKISRLTLTNHSPRARRLSVTAYLEWVLGVSRGGTAPFVITEMDSVTGAMFARNPWRRDFNTRVAFADLGGAQTAWTGDRAEFLGRNGTHDQPAGLVRRERLSGRSGAALDPCCALQTTVDIPAGGQATVVFVFGDAGSHEEARELVQRYRTKDLDGQLKAVVDRWDRILGTVQVTTPDRGMNLMLNHWLLYQTLASRLWARTAFYQASGAFGFRDQLQDVMSLVVALPALARNQLMKAASHQFVEGDVQHWWHEPAGRGVRTRISDDLLWLPYVASHYLEVTGDTAVLDEAAPFLEGQVLAAGELEAYFEPRIAAATGTLFEHCARAIDRSLAVGTHGLPLMGTGDWNDGMNRVGAGGKGESVWLAWFLHAVLEQWTPIAQARGELARAKAWKAHAAALRQAVEREGWDGSWYRRAYFDDGTPLGSAANDECAIDSIAQSWSVISGAADPARARLAMASLDQRLVRRGDGLVLLLAPPFDKTEHEPGYIKGYVPGVRENGGQYTHAAAWAAIAFAALGDGDKTGELLAMLNPISHAATPSAVRQYKVEPYVVAADVYSEAPHAGRGGWTWYTGSAGWLYRAGVEWLLGFRVKGERFEIDPCIPRAWPGFSIAFRHCSTRYEIVVENPKGVCRGVQLLELDGAAQSDRTGIAIADDQKTHRVRVVLG